MARQLWHIVWAAASSYAALRRVANHDFELADYVGGGYEGG